MKTATIIVQLCYHKCSHLTCFHSALPMNSVQGLVIRSSSTNRRLHQSSKREKTKECTMHAHVRADRSHASMCHHVGTDQGSTRLLSPTDRTCEPG